MNETGDTSTVTLDADVNPFEQGLDKANAKVAGWTANVEGKFASLATAVQAKSANLINTLSSFADKGGSEIGGALGGKIGMAAGAAIGGPVGAYIGKQLGELGGEELSKSFDFETITKGLNELAEGAKPIGDKFKQNWSEMRGDAANAFDEIKKLAQGINVKGLLAGNDDAWAGLVANAEAAWDAVSEFGDKTAFRFQETVDTIWGAIQAPIAKVADWLQALLTNLGLVDAGTQSWGDSLKQIENVGRQALGALGYGLGYLEGLFKKAAGYILEYFGMPLQKMYAQLLDGIASMINGANELSAATGLGKFESLTNAATKLEMAARGLRGTLDETKKKADELQSISPEDQAKKRQQDFLDAVKRGQTLVDDDRQAKLEAEWIAAANAGEIESDAIAGPLGQLATAAAGIDKATSAMVSGNRETTNAIIQAQNAQAQRAAAAVNPQDPARAAADKVAANTKDTADGIEELVQMMRDSPVIMAV